LDASEWLQRRCEWRHFTAQTLLKLGDPRWRFFSSFRLPTVPANEALLLLLLRLFAGELLATSQILYFVLGLRFFKTIFASFPQEEIPIDMGESSSFLSFSWRNFAIFLQRKWVFVSPV
jgi:hypothetical protein